jgi:hypothetical protein
MLAPALNRRNVAFLGCRMEWRTVGAADFDIGLDDQELSPHQDR